MKILYFWENVAKKLEEAYIKALGVEKCNREKGHE